MTGSERTPPLDQPTDVSGAYRVVCEFQQKYGEDLESAQHYLDRLVSTTALEYAEGYRPWLKALKDFIQGIYMLTRKIPLPDPKRFREALSIFSLDSTVNFVFDLCAAARRTLERDWADTFRKHMLEMLAAVQIIAQQQSMAPQRTR